MKCSPTIKKRFDNHQFSAVTMFDELCADEYSEAEEIADNGFPQNRQDLFMEQGEYQLETRCIMPGTKEQQITSVIFQNCPKTIMYFVVRFLKYGIKR